MKSIVAAFAILAVASLSSAQTGGQIGIFSDTPGYADCNLNDVVNQANTVYVVHNAAPVATSVRFRLIHNWDHVVVGPVDYGVNAVVGDIWTGVTVTYPGCQGLPYLVATLTFTPLQATPECTVVLAVPDPTAPSGQIDAIDCDHNVLAAHGGYLCVNAMFCCIVDDISECDMPVAAERSTWGAIKALYR